MAGIPPARRGWPLLLALAACGGSTEDPPTNPNSDTPTKIVAVSATSQLGAIGTAVAALPSVRVTSAAGAGVRGVTVSFAITSGGGAATGATTVTSTDGVATVGGWILGPAAGTNSLTATVTGLPPVTFTATTTTVTQAFTLSPAIAATAPRGTTTFTATTAAGTPVSVTWSVNGVSGGSAQLGAISSAGVYTAPQTIPDGDSIIVTALSSENSVQQSATVYFIPNNTDRDYYVPIPRVVDLQRGTRTRFLVVPPSNAATVSLIRGTNAAVPLTPIGSGVLTFTVDASTLTYVDGTLHAGVGQLDYRTSDNTRIKLGNLSVNVRDAGMPDVPITQLAADAQRSPYILNLRVDTATIGPYPAITKRALEVLGGDRFDFVAVVATVTSNNNRNYASIRNDVRGTGLQPYDNSIAWGGAGRLRGAIAFPIDGFFDGAERGFLHEHGHAWINFATDAQLRPGVSHWPLSTMAHGIMGFSIGGQGGQGGDFPFLLTPLGDGTVRVTQEPVQVVFTPLDLYVMGLLPADSVPPSLILPPSTNFNSLTNGQVLPATTYTIADYIAGMGTRVPSSATSPRQFATACVVLSYGRLLTPSEMAFFDYASARAETRTMLRTGAGPANAPGFFLATGGRATLTTRLP